MSAITDIFSSQSDSAGPTPVQYNTFQPSNLTGNDQNFNTAVNNNFAAAGDTAPQWLSYLNSTINNPYAAPAQTAANNAGAAYTGVGTQSLNNAGNLSSAANTTLNTAFDPQSSLYNTQHQGNTDTTNAALAARGLNTSGAGADLAAQSDQSFNQGWQNNALGRQTQGITAANSGFTNANQIGLSGAGAINAGGQAPLSGYTTNQANTNTGLTNFQTGSTSTENQTLSALLSYLGLGASQSNAQGNFDQQYFNNLETQNQNQNDLNDEQFGAIGNLLGTVGGSQLSSSSPAWLAALAA